MFSSPLLKPSLAVTNLEGHTGICLYIKIWRVVILWQTWEFRDCTLLSPSGQDRNLLLATRNHGGNISCTGL